MSTIKLKNILDQILTENVEKEYIVTYYIAKGDDDLDYDEKVKATSEKEAIAKIKKDAPRLARAFSAELVKSKGSLKEDESNLRSQLHTLIGNEMRLGKRVGMTGASHHEEEHKKAEKAVEDFLRKNPSMEEYRDEVEDNFTKLLYK